ncbi:hypothetical protein M0802_014781 [Mischocyttarus mexicanus]|nr:hypothetical protein M0802_014781 [Mischocyttarus mexicanus]
MFGSKEDQRNIRMVSHGNFNNEHFTFPKLHRRIRVLLGGTKYLRILEEEEEEKKEKEEEKIEEGEEVKVEVEVEVEPCEKPSDYRGEQCAAFDDIPYSGQLLKWYPHYNPARPCSLICRGEQSLDNSVNRLEQQQQRQQQQQGSNKRTLNHDAQDDLQFDTDETIVVQLAEKVEDGTRCYLDGHDICINGECMWSTNLIIKRSTLKGLRKGVERKMGNEYSKMLKRAYRKVAKMVASLNTQRAILAVVNKVFRMRSSYKYD